MRRLLLTLAAFAAVGSVGSVVAQQEPHGPYAGVPYVKKNLYARNDLRGKPAPEIKVEKWLAGAAPKTEGKVVLVDLWATWCPPCRELLKELNGWNRKFGKDLVIIGISDEPTDTVKAFMQKNAMNYNVAVDSSHKVMEKVGVQGIPHVLVISQDGIVRWQGFPQSQEDTLTDEKLAAIILASKASK